MATNANSSPADIPPKGEQALSKSPVSPEAAAEDGDTRDSKELEPKEEEQNNPNDQEDERDQDEKEDGEVTAAPPLPDEELPPLPSEAPPSQEKDDGWEPVWDGNAHAYYFYNRYTGLSQWDNPRVPVTATGAPGTEAQESAVPPPRRLVAGGYNPAIHGDYDPTAPYAQQHEQDPGGSAAGQDPAQLYTATGHFNRFTGKWQAQSLTPENFNDENKSRRQMNAYFDVDAASNHDGRSLKAERSGKKLSKQEVKAFREKRRERKEEKRRAWLRE
jgi:hypothetical protein